MENFLFIKVNKSIEHSAEEKFIVHRKHLEKYGKTCWGINKNLNMEKINNLIHNNNLTGLFSICLSAKKTKKAKIDYVAKLIAIYNDDNINKKCVPKVFGKFKHTRYLCLKNLEPVSSESEYSIRKFEVISNKKKLEDSIKNVASYIYVKKIK